MGEEDASDGDTSDVDPEKDLEMFVHQMTFGGNNFACKMCDKHHDAYKCPHLTGDVEQQKATFAHMRQYEKDRDARKPSKSAKSTKMHVLNAGEDQASDLASMLGDDEGADFQEGES